MLRAQNPGAALYLAVGSDMLLGFTHWYRWQRILQLAALVVQSRTGRDMDALTAAGAALERQGGRIVFAAAVPVPCALQRYPRRDPPAGPALRARAARPGAPPHLRKRPLRSWGVSENP